MRAIVWIVPTLLLIVLSYAGDQRLPAHCRFPDVARVPNDPAILDQSTRRPLRPEGILRPVESQTVRAWVRVSETGAVTDVCLPDGFDDHRGALVEAALRLRYSPARHRGRPMASVRAVAFEIVGRFTWQEEKLAEVSASSDVAWLERLAGSDEAAYEVWRSQQGQLGQAKELRVAAFARLGELGTPQSVAARKRVTARLAARPIVPYQAALNGGWPHPGWHMMDYRPSPVARTLMRDGTRVVVTIADLLGPWQLFALTCEDDSLLRCSRPKPVATWRWEYAKVRAGLRETAPRKLQLDIVPRGRVQPSSVDGTASITSSPKRPSAQRLEIALAAIDRDSDGDGWTDLEERTLGLDPARRDSDGDGVEDGHDRAPLFAPSRADDNEDAAILRAAIFAVFGIVESRWALFAPYEGRSRLEVPGLSSPIMFHRPLRPDAARHSSGGVFVRWRIVRKSATDAVVEIVDWEGPLTAGAQEVFLRRVDGEWIVVAQQVTWIS